MKINSVGDVHDVLRLYKFIRTTYGSARAGFIGDWLQPMVRRLSWVLEPTPFYELYKLMGFPPNFPYICALSIKISGCSRANDRLILQNGQFWSRGITVVPHFGQRLPGPSTIDPAGSLLSSDGFGWVFGDVLSDSISLAGVACLTPNPPQCNLAFLFHPLSVYILKRGPLRNAPLRYFLISLTR